jgi:DNA repair protein RecN (Recombination protein N)
VLGELRVRQLGVIEDVTIVFEPGVTALSGETGAGKTLVVDAIDLLTGGAAQPTMVRPGAQEAVVEGRFHDGEEELVLSRVVPTTGRGRCYLDGRMVPLARLAELGQQLVDLHGQHAQQSLFSASAQRDALDEAGRVDASEVAVLKKTVRELRDSLAGLGGDERSRARQMDLLSYQLTEIESAGIEDPGEDEALQAEEELLADAAGLAQAAALSHDALAGEDGAVDRLGQALAAIAGRSALEKLGDRLVAVADEVSDVAAEARRIAETVEADPDRLASIGERRRILTEMRRKYGRTLGEVIAYREQVAAELEELLSHDQRAAAVAVELEQAEKELAAATERLWQARRQAAGPLSESVQAELRTLAMPLARFEVRVEDDSVVWMLGANPGEPVLPLAKVASGGELARAMLAARLVLGRAGGEGGGPSTLVFDEVDAGVGGEAAVAVGRALAALAPRHQVLVVTHLPQVAAMADHHLVVTKEVHGERTVASVAPVVGEERVVELARMLSGRPESDSARRHAAELLASASSSGGGARSTRNGRERG